MRFTHAITAFAVLITLSACGLPQHDETKYPRLSQMQGTSVSTLYGLYGVPEDERQEKDGSIKHVWIKSIDQINTNYKEGGFNEHPLPDKSLLQKTIKHLTVPQENKVEELECQLVAISRGSVVESVTTVTNGLPASHIQCTEFLDKWFKYQEGAR
jgi:hypothetical protein